jgi:hypothetical protein
MPFRLPSTHRRAPAGEAEDQERNVAGRAARSQRARTTETFPRRTTRHCSRERPPRSRMQGRAYVAKQAGTIRIQYRTAHAIAYATTGHPRMGPMTGYHARSASQTLTGRAARQSGPASRCRRTLRRPFETAATRAPRPVRWRTAIRDRSRRPRRERDARERRREAGTRAVEVRVIRYTPRSMRNNDDNPMQARPRAR